MRATHRPFHFLFLALCLLPASASAQSASSRGERKIDEVVIGEWTKNCFKTPDQKQLCRTFRNVTLQTGQQFFRIDIVQEQDQQTARVELNLPLGLFLPAGVTLAVDEFPEVRIPYITCLANLCRAADGLSQEFVTAMKSKQRLSVKAVDINLLAVSLPLSLEGFAKVFDGAPSQSFDLGLQLIK